MSLMSSFLAERNIPTVEKFAAITEGLHDLLNQAAMPYASGIAPERLLLAAKYLRLAREIAERELEREVP